MEATSYPVWRVISIVWLVLGICAPVRERPSGRDHPASYPHGAGPEDI